MMVLAKTTGETISRIPFRSIVFFACFYAYTWRVIEPYLIYYGYGIIIEYPDFSTGWGFLKGHLNHASGLLEYTAGLLSHLFYFSWFGALIITAIAWLISALTARLIRLSGTGESRFIRYLPAILVMIMFNQYYNSLYTCLSVLAGLGFWVLYEKIRPDNTAGAIFVFVISLGVLYYIAGGSASIIFVLTSGIYVILFKGKGLIGGSNLLIGTLTVFLFGFHLSTRAPIETFSFMMGFGEVENWSRELIPDMCLYLFFPVLTTAVGIGKNLLRHNPGREDHKKDSSSEQFGYKKLKPVLQTAVLAALCILAALYSFDAGAKKKCRIIYLDRLEKWVDVIEFIPRLSFQEYSLFYNHFLNKALYFSGRLGGKMFFYPQQTEAFLLNSDVSMSLKEFIGSHTFLQLGQVNLAEKKAHEFLEVIGQHWNILKILALINIVKDQPETARMYIRAMSRDLIHGSQAKELLATLDKDSHQTSNPQVMHLRSVMLKTDSHLDDTKAEKLFLELLDDNPSNRMAFEYLMGHYLISGQLDKFAANISRLKDLNFNTIPVHYAEAILTYQSIMGRNINMQGMIIPNEIIEKFKVFVKVHDSYKDKQAAVKDLRPQFGYRYYYYYTFYGTDIDL